MSDQAGRGSGEAARAAGGGRTLRQAARACEKTARDLAAFAEQLPDVPGPAEIIEYDTLLARDEAVRAERDDLFRQAGVEADSVESTG